MYETAAGALRPAGPPRPRSTNRTMTNLNHRGLLATTPSPAERRAIQASLAASVLLSLLKWTAFVVTGSVAVLSDAVESVVHLAAVAFAAWSLALARKPPDREHLYGHDKITFFSAGVEGSLIVVAGLGVLYTAAEHLLSGYTPSMLHVGAALCGVVAAVNSILGTTLIRVGRRHDNLVLIANGKHVLSDALTSGGVLATLVVVSLTGWSILDPVVGLLIATLLVCSGVALVRRATSGLMDESDPELDRRLRQLLDHWVRGHQASYHGLRHRRSGHLVWVDVHVLLPGALSLEEAHRRVTELEEQIYRLIDGPAIVLTHLEPIEAHDGHHPTGDPARGHLGQIEQRRAD